jgi:hypothetical protein
LQVSQPLLQHFGLQQRLLQTKMRSSNEPQHFFLQQPVLQAFSQPQAGAAASQPQAGAAASQPQAGAAAAQPLSQHLGLQQRLKLNKG